jgi:two-component system, chemotaxis family, sensor kinase CheA
MSDLISDFIADVREGYRRLRPALSLWTADPDNKDARDAVFRFVHTVHGNAGFLDFERFAVLAAAAEEGLAQMRDGRLSAHGPHTLSVQALVERIGAIAEAIDAGIGLSAQDEPALIARLGIDVPKARLLGVDQEQPAPERARSIRLPTEQFEQLASCFESVAAAHRDLLGVVTDIGDLALATALSTLSDRIASMDQALAYTRLQPVERLYVALDRIVSQTATLLDKQVELVTTGSALMVDRDAIDGLRDPLLHLIRNALDHGFETPDVRAAANKAPTGTLTLSASVERRVLTLTIADDGAGIDREAIKQSAAKVGVLLACEPGDLAGDQLIALMCTPGVTTARESSALSGRGVGLDAVRASVTRLGGTIALDDRPGRGACFTLRVPLRHTPVLQSDAA